MVAYSKSLVEEKKVGGKSLGKLCEHMAWPGLEAVYDFWVAAPGPVITDENIKHPYSVKHNLMSFDIFSVSSCSLFSKASVYKDKPFGCIARPAVALRDCVKECILLGQEPGRCFAVSWRTAVSGWIKHFCRLCKVFGRAWHEVMEHIVKY